MMGMKGVETVGTVVRGRYGNLGRIASVVESSRCSAGHLTSPLDVVVVLEPLSFYNHTSSWASDLTLAQDGDIGAHESSVSYVGASWSA